MAKKETVILKEKDSDRYLTIWVDDAGGDAIEAALLKIRFLEPYALNPLGAITGKLGAGHSFTLIDVEPVKRPVDKLFGDAMEQGVRPERVTVVGAGRMGLAIAQFIATEGCSVKLVSRRELTLNRAAEEIRPILCYFKNWSICMAQWMRFLVELNQYRGFQNPSLTVIFCLKPSLRTLNSKRALLTDMNPHLDDKTIIASSTSTINLSTFKGILTKPDRLLIAHWLNPAFIMPLVEIAVGEETSIESAERMRSFLKEIGKIPVIVKDSPGFIIARLQSTVFSEAARILEEGIASAEDIDTVTKIASGFSQLVFGMLEFVDLGGLDILYSTEQFLYSALGREQFKTPALVKEKMERNELSTRTGKGIYEYSGTDTRSLFENRYKGLVELLDFIKYSKTLALEGGVKIRDKEADIATYEDGCTGWREWCFCHGSRFCAPGV